jgi:16S rRNA (cytidine1402-2'-O)-methyltransferase
MDSTVYLIPSVLDESAVETIPSYVLEAIKQCQVFFVEDERTTRRFFKKLWKEMVIDDYTWVTMEKPSENSIPAFKNFLQQGKNIGIVSDAGCPGIADPGQWLVKAAHEAGALVKPLVGPNSILLALMASGLNGQQFQFCGYLPIETSERTKKLRELEEESGRKNCTQVFIETPYRNNAMLEAIVKVCKPGTRLCIAAEITAASEFIHTKTIGEWKKSLPDIHKKPAIFCLLAGS